MPRPKKSTQVKRKNAATGTAASKNVGDVIETQVDQDGNKEKIRVRFADTHFPDGSPQSLYFPSDHPEAKHRGWFKGIARILEERGISVSGLKL
ncbi:hypothetical protein FRC11_000556, partial [Ceratobasidium sp. 423]